MAIPSSAEKDRFLRVAAVSYEGSVFGWDVNTSEATLDCNLGFGFHATQGSLKAIAVSASGKYLVCGGMDERIRIFNVAENRNLGELTGHSGCVTCLEFVGDQFVVSGSEDNNLGIWRVQDWLCVHILGGHKAAVTDIAVHPSGKLALSVSKDNTLKVWNLVQGRCAFTRRLHGHAVKVQWSASGEMYSLVVGSELQVYSAGDNSCLGTMKFPSRINQARFTHIGAAARDGVNPEHFIAVVCEDRKLVIVDSACKALTAPYSLDVALSSGRPRDMCSVQPAEVADREIQAALEGEGHSLVVATSTGVVAVLSARALAEGNIRQGEGDAAEAEEEAEEEDPGGALFAMQASASIAAEPRLTAVVAWNPTLKAQKAPKTSKKKAAAAAGAEGDVGLEEEEEEEEDGDEEEAERANTAYLAAQKEAAKGPQKHKERPVARLFDPKNDKLSKKQRKEQKEKEKGKGKGKGDKRGGGGADDQKGKKVRFD